MKKRIICILLALALGGSAAACGSGSTSYGVKTVQTLVSQDYSLAFRNDDPIYFYVTAAIETLAAEGKVDELATKWFGDRIITFNKRADALSELTAPAVQDFTIGIDVNSFPMA